ncbi:MAG TPA: 2-C-methyl-D-erythritol 2,4-cyclodiphosphate synthase [Gemmatimonadaceae bacterium]|nr:2-C-methyl-D-erythritol 2,4-cyclodiphosphate synthase [Gemmatimonadaceae bacterium]
MTRVGIGYDSHRFVAGDGVLLGGVRIPSSLSLVGHSDADAVAHALIDAMLGAAALGDVGSLFPDTDPANKGRNSIEMLGIAALRVREAGWRVSNVDITVVCETPHIARARDGIRRTLSIAIDAPVESIWIKGKTNEKMGWIGRGEGLAVIAVAALDRI